MAPLSEDGIAAMRRAGKILVRALEAVRVAAHEGISFLELDALAREIILREGGAPAFLNYRPEGARRSFRASLCTSLNDVVVHGVPTERRLRRGDLLKLDLGVRFEGYYADAAVSVGIGELSPQGQKLIAATREALTAAIREVRAGAHLGDVGHAISETVRRHGFRVVKGLTGHGIGTELHGEPAVTNEGRRGEGARLREGMALAIEPMVSAGSSRIVQLEDDSYATEDGSLAAHFEHTVLVTETGSEILTVL